MFPEDRPVAEDFERAEVTIDGETKPVWRSGSGPGVIIMHEVPSITPEVARFARIVRDRGFTVCLPKMFGTVDRPVSGGYVVPSLLHCCISREFQVLEAGGSSPITDWLRKLCRQVHEELGGPGVGALGMCMTGNFALALRFTADPVCTRARFKTLRRELGEGFESIEIDSGPGNPWGIKRIAHRVLTEELVDDDGHPTKQALDRVLGFFEERLRRPA